MKSKAATPVEYIESLSPERRPTIERLRQVLLESLPEGFEETMEYGMLAYVVPHRLFPDGYHCDPKRPLPFMNIASQKQYVSLYHMGLYDGPLLDWFTHEWDQHTTARLDMGKCCIRFRKLDRIPYVRIATLAALMGPKEWVEAYQKATSR